MKQAEWNFRQIPAERSFSQIPVPQGTVGYILYLRTAPVWVKGAGLLLSSTL